MSILSKKIKNKNMSNTEKTNRSKNSITKIKNKYSFIYLLLGKKIKIQKGIKKVVSIIKNNDSPSIPKIKYRFKLPDHSILLKN
jgi:hypothetical protein